MRNWLYHILIHAVTTEYYRNCLGYVPPGSRILDVGIGNGLMIERFHWLIRAKRLRITGIDIDRQYLVHCRRLIRKYRLDDCIDVHEGAAERYEPVQEDRFDFVLFSMSFMLLSDPQSVLRRAGEWLMPGGEIIFAQAMYRQRSRFMDVVKPKLKYVTTVDFGRVTYERDFFALLSENDLAVHEDRVVGREPFHGQCRVIIASAGSPDRDICAASAGAPLVISQSA
jgi:SAM-dependent methyltransferase